jgi:hypothetical protein
MNFDAILGRYLRACCVKLEVVPKNKIWVLKNYILRKKVIEEPGDWISHPEIVKLVSDIQSILFFNGTDELQPGTHNFSEYKFKKEKLDADGNCVLDEKNKKVYDSILNEKHCSHSNVLRFIHMVSESTVFEEAERRSLTLAPIHDIRRHFITIDTTTSNKWTMYSDSTRQNISVSNLYSPERVSRKHKFTGTISTDGISACIHFRRLEKPIVVQPKEFKPRKVKVRTKKIVDNSLPNSLEVVDHPNEIFYPNKRIIAIDPGRTNLCTAVEFVGDFGDTKKSWKTYSFTRAQYYHESGINKANKQTKKWLNGCKLAINELSKTKSKAKMLDEFNLYVNAVSKNYYSLWNEKTKKRWSHLKFSLHRGKQSSVDRFLERLEKPSKGKDVEIEIAYGNAGFASGGRGEKCVPVKWFKERVARKFKVVDVDEFRSSKLDYQTHNLLGKIIKIDEAENCRDIRGLHWLKTKNLSCKLVSRDSNAAKNIHYLHHLLTNGLERPKSFLRVDGFVLPKQQSRPVPLLNVKRTKQLFSGFEFFNETISMQ